MLLVWLGSYPQFFGVLHDERLAQRQEYDDEDMLIITLLEEDTLTIEETWL